jgi:hypothetical protein
MKIRDFGPLVAGLLAFAYSDSAHAQIPMNAPPIVSYYDAPPAYGVYLPASVPVGNSYYGQYYGGMGGTYFPIPSDTVSYFHPSAAIIAPVQVRYGLFGRTYVRSPMYRVSFNAY